MVFNPHLNIGTEVAEALRNGMPLVALESTIIAHGMPYPRNVETAHAVESEIRGAGAVPATIAVFDGRIKVGLSMDEMERIGRAGAAFAKLSRRDLPLVIAQKGSGATTVAATMIGAALAGIRIFATGGIGGVHRDAGQTFDVSADLQELAHTNVAVVCAGAKAILDLPLTLEYLETHGVPVIGYQTDEFPAFYSAHSGLPLEHRLDTPEQIAATLSAKWELGLSGGVVVANPIPAAFSIAPAAIQGAIDQALEEADRQGIKGKAITPFLLARIEQLTRGASLDANVQLVLNNARLAAAVAHAYYSL